MAKVTRFPSEVDFQQAEYNDAGILSEAPWTLVEKMKAADGVGAMSTVTGIYVAPKVENKPNANPSPSPGSTESCVCASMKPSAWACRHLPYVATHKCWVDKCPFCGGHLLNNPKGVPEGEWTCAKCNADFDGVCGAEKLAPPRKYLTACSKTSTKLGGKLGGRLGDDPNSHITTKPARIRGWNFGFNLKENARINKLYVIWKPWVKNASGKEVNVPNIPGATIVVDGSAAVHDTRTLPFYAASRNAQFTPATMRKGHATPADINHKDFRVLISPARNTSSNAGKVYNDFIAVEVDYTDPTYSLSATMTSPLLIGNNLTYTLTLKNTNNAHQGKKIPVTVKIPAGLQFVSSKGNAYNQTTQKWMADLNAKGVAVLTLNLRAISPGNQSIKASVDGFTTSINKTTKITPANYTLQSSLPANVAQGHNISYRIIINSDSALQETIYVNVPIPAGFAFVSSDPSYNEQSEIWAATFNSKQTDSLVITLAAETPGKYSQTITAPRAKTITNNITILPSDIGTANYAEIPIPQELLPYMVDGQRYYVSCDMEIVSQLTGDVFEGEHNFCVTVQQGANEEEKEDASEVVGTAPDAYNIYERVCATFLYDAAATTAIRIYGQYSGLNPGDFVVRFGRWSISNLDCLYEEAGAIIDDPGLLLVDSNYTWVSLEAGESSKPITFCNFNFSGRESDPTLITSGLGIELDYICDSPSILTATIRTNNQTATQSVPLDPSENTVIIGNDSDKWELMNIDLEDIEVDISITNTSLDTSTIQLKNLQFILYSETDDTYGNMGFMINGEHSRNYGIFLSNDGAKNEGTVPSITTYDLSNSEGELVSQLDLKSKKITLKFTISGDDLIDAQERLKQATKFLSNDLNSLGLPIPNRLVVDWDSGREYKVILNDEIKVTLDTFTYTCEANFIVPEGLGWDQMKITGPIDINEGLIEVRPIIQVLTIGGPVIIFDNISNQGLTINNEFDANMVLTIDCESRTVTGDDGIDYTKDVTFNSAWPTIRNKYDYTGSTGCFVQAVKYQEGN